MAAGTGGVVAHGAVPWGRGPLQSPYCSQLYITDLTELKEEKKKTGWTPLPSWNGKQRRVH